MPFFNFNGIKIAGLAAAVPTEVVKLDSFYSQFGEEYVQKFSESTGVKQFHRVRKNQTASDLAYVAANNVLNHFDVDRNDIKALVFVAHSTDYRRPATACVLHHRLKLNKDCCAFDISLGCSAFVYGLQSVCSLMKSSDIDKALLLVGESMTQLVNPKDKSVAMLFGDGGAAILLEKDEKTPPIQGLLRTDGDGYRTIIAPGGGARYPNAPHTDFKCADGNYRNLYNSIMKGEDVFSFTISDVVRTVKEFLEHSQKSASDYDCLAFHQANQFIHKMIAKKLKADLTKMPLRIDRYANTSAAAIPLLISDVFGHDNTSENITMLACGFGVGLSWGVTSFTINTSDILPVTETDEVFSEGIITIPDEI